MKCFIFFSIVVLICASTLLEAQIASFPYIESFDGVTAPALPSGWSIVGFKDTASSPHSSPKCIYGIGNTTLKSLTSLDFDFTNHVPDKLTFWERRSGTALGYRLEVRASLDGFNTNLLLTRFDTSTSSTAYIQRTVDLSSSGLQQKSSVQFRWILLKDSTNNTGVLRLDDITLTVATGYDVSMSRMNISPNSPSRIDSLVITLVVRNTGILSSSNAGLKLYEDMNCNGIPELPEQFSSMTGITLSPGDSMICNFSHPPMKTGQHRFIGVVDYPLDQYWVNDTVRAIFNVGNVRGDILVNEIMYYPTGDEPEWVECVNTSLDTINLKNWKISDSYVSTKSLLSSIDVLIPPLAYGVIAKDVNFSISHPGVPFIIASFNPLNNTTPDAIVMYDPQTNTIDSIMYDPSWGGQNGKSLERIDLQSSSTLSGNWGTSQDSLGCTPGKINSIARLDYDLAISNLTQTRIVSNGKMVSVINVTVQNIGRQTIDSVIVHFYADRNRSMYPDTSELLQSVVSTQRIFAGDSVQISESLPQLSAGEVNVVVVAENWSDEQLRNNRASVTIKIGYEPHSYIINEIMYDPLDSQNEWLELYNRSPQPIDLAHWTFNDRATSSGVNLFVISDSAMMVPSRGFAVVAAESSMCNIFPNLGSPHPDISLSILHCSGGFSFNKDGDAIVLKDLTGQTIDSVAYLPRWHHPDVVDARGRSLERINPNFDSNDPRNWSTCLNVVGGTPGKVNSIFTMSSVTSSKISLLPNPFSPDGDGYEDFCVVHYNLPMMTSTLNVRIYDIKGRLVRTLANGELAGAHGEIVWDGFCNDKQRARIGVYLIFLEATDRSSGRVERAKAVAVVATKL